MLNNGAKIGGGIVGNIRTSPHGRLRPSGTWVGLREVSCSSAKAQVKSDVISSHDGVVLGDLSVFKDIPLHTHIYKPSGPPRRGGFVELNALGFYLTKNKNGDNWSFSFKVDGHFDGNGCKRLPTERLLTTLVGMEDIPSAHELLSTHNDTRGCLDARGSRTILSKLITVFENKSGEWERRIDKAISYYLNMRFEAYALERVAGGGCIALPSLDNVPTDMIRDMIVFVLTSNALIPLKDLGLIALSDTIAEDICAFVNSGNTLTYFDKYSHLETIDGLVFSCSNLVTDAKPLMILGSEHRHQLMQSEQSIIISSETPGERVELNDTMRAATYIAAAKLTRSDGSRGPCQAFSFFRHTEMSDHIFAVPDEVRTYVAPGLEVPLKPVVHEFIRRAIVHMRLFSKMKDGFRAPIDVPLNLAPIMVVGKALNSDAAFMYSKIQKIIVLIMSMYTNGVLPRDVVDIWKSNGRNVCDVDAFAYILENIDRWIIDDVVGKNWHPVLFYHSRMEPYYIGARLAGCSAEIVKAGTVVDTPSKFVWAEERWADAVGEPPIVEKDDVGDVAIIAPALPPRDNVAKTQVRGRGRGRGRGKYNSSSRRGRRGD